VSDLHTINVSSGDFQTAAISSVEFSKTNVARDAMVKAKVVGLSIAEVVNEYRGGWGLRVLSRCKDATDSCCSGGGKKNREVVNRRHADLRDGEEEMEGNRCSMKVCQTLMSK
jgi:hypothetical protein